MKMSSVFKKLVFLVVLSTAVASMFSLAKFETAKEGSSNASVAKFIVDVTGEDVESIDLNSNFKNSYNYNISVKNKKDSVVSQVSTKYDIIVEFIGNVPEYTKLSIGDIIYEADGNTSVFTFSNVGTFTAGVENENNHTLNIDISSVSDRRFYNGVMSIYVDAVQID